MSPSTVNECGSHNHFEDDLNLSIRGLGVEYPPYRVGPEALETLANRFCPSSTALNKVLTINRYTGIETRAAVGEVDHPLVNQKDPPDIKALDNFFREEGVRLSVNASRKAIEEWGGDVSEITHVISTTCTNSANPGFDHFVVKELGINPSIEKILLHGVGCSGGLAAIRTAANLALGSTFRKRPARILVLACEISSLLVRSELDSIAKNDEVRIGVCLFSDCASACIISNGVGPEPFGNSAVYDLLGWEHKMIDDTEKDLGFDIDPLGWKVVLTPQVPTLAAAAVPATFESLVASVPSLRKSASKAQKSTDFDWALHPGGSTIITGVQSTMNLTEEHLRASYEIYMNYGNSSSATIMAVMNRLRSIEGSKHNVIACAFGPGISLEMMVLRKNSTKPMDDRPDCNGDMTDTSSTEGLEQPSINGHEAPNGYENMNGHVTQSSNISGNAHVETADLPVPDID